MLALKQQSDKPNSYPGRLKKKGLIFIPCPSSTAGIRGCCLVAGIS